MQLNLRKIIKNIALYSGPGLKGSVRFLKSQFENEVPPATVEVSGAFAEPKVPAAKMTKEERKIARANAPKLTESEKITRDEKRIAERKAKLAAAGQ